MAVGQRGESLSATAAPDRETPSAVTTRDFLLLGGLVVVGFLLQIYMSLQVPLDPDELDHLHQAFLYDQGRRAFVDFLAEKPPGFVFLLAKLTSVLGSGTLWGYRVPFVLLGVGLGLATYVLVRRLLGRVGALIALFILLSTTVFQVVTMSIRPDGAMSLFMVITFVYLLDWHRRGGRRAIILAGFFAALACIAKLMPLPVVALIGLWIVTRGGAWRDMSRPDAWRPALDFLIGIAIGGLAMIVVAGRAAFVAIGFMVELWTTVIPAASVAGSSTIGTYMLHEAVLFSLATIAAVVLLFAASEHEDGGFVRLLSLSYIGFWPMLWLKRSSHIQDLLLPVVLGAILSALLVVRVAGSTRISVRGRRALLTVLVALFTLEGANAGRLLVSNERFPLQTNAFVIQSQVEDCGGNPMEFGEFMGCFGDRLFWEDHVRLSLAQQQQAVAFFNRTAGTDLDGLSGISLNVFTPNSRSFSPPQLFSVYPKMPTIYETVAAGQAPFFEGVFSAVYDRSGFRHALSPSTEGLSANFHRVLSVDEPAAVIHVDPVTIRVYSDHPGLYDYLEEHYSVVFDLASATFFACHRRLLTEDACLAALEESSLSPADRLTLEVVQDTTLTADEVERRILGALELDPGHSEANFLMGRIVEQKGDAYAARAHFSVAFRGSRGHDLDAVIEWADALDRLGDRSAALRVARRVQRFFIWEDGGWVGIFPWALFFARNPEDAVARYEELTVRLTGR